MGSDGMVGHKVEIRTSVGILYRGVVRSVCDAGELGERFELGSDEDPAYQRWVYVADRAAQIAQHDDPGPVRAARRLGPEIM